MLTTLALAAALSTAPAQGGLKLANDRVTFGELGPTRPDSKYLPGDVFFISFDIEGISVTPDGKVSYGMAMEVTDSAGKKVFAQPSANRDDSVPLGGTKLPARAYVTIGNDQPAGEYTCKVTVTDRKGGASQSLTRKFEVLPRAFGLVGLFSTADEAANTPAPMFGVVGQSIWVNFNLINFTRDQATKQPNVQVEMRVLDSSGEPTLAKPTPFTLNKGVDENLSGIPFRFVLPMTRAGKFTLELKATDLLTKKSATLKFPVEVVAAGR